MEIPEKMSAMVLETPGDTSFSISFVERAAGLLRVLAKPQKQAGSMCYTCLS